MSSIYETFNIYNEISLDDHWLVVCLLFYSILWALYSNLFVSSYQNTLTQISSFF